MKCTKRPSASAKTCSKWVNQQTTNDSDDDDWINTLAIDGDNQLKCRMLVGTHKVVFQIDPGATVNTLHVRFVDKIEHTKRVLRMSNATEAKALGRCHAMVKHPKNDKVYAVDRLVVSDGYTPLLRYRTAKIIKLLNINDRDIEKVTAVTHVYKNEKLGALPKRVQLFGRRTKSMMPTAEAKMRPLYADISHEMARKGGA